MKLIRDIAILLMLIFLCWKARADDMSWSEAHPSSNGGIDEQMEAAHEWDVQEGKYADAVDEPTTDDNDDDDDGDDD